MRPRATLLLAALLATSLSSAPAGASHCGTPPENVHTYALVWSAAATTSQTGSVGTGQAAVWDNNTFDCDGNGVADDFDGDYEFGVGGGYLGIAGHEDVNATCGLGLHLHAGTQVVVADMVGVVGGVAGYEGWDEVGEAYCDNDGTIGDDPEDCIVPFVGSVPADPCSGQTPPAGVNLDAGVWVFLPAHASDSPSVNTPMTGTIAVA